MRPEPPPLKGWDQFTEAATNRDINFRREYEPEVEIDGEVFPGGWVNVISKEALCTDGHWHAWFLHISDVQIEQAQPAVWDLHFDLLEQAWQHHLDEHGVQVA